MLPRSLSPFTGHGSTGCDVVHVLLLLMMFGEDSQDDTSSTWCTPKINQKCFSAALKLILFAIVCTVQLQTATELLLRARTALVHRSQFHNGHNRIVAAPIH